MTGSRDLAAMIAMIEQRQFARFRWGSNDCVRFTGRVVAAQTGADPLAGLPRWNSRRAALAACDELGGLIAAIDARFVRIAPAFAKRGDIAGIEDRLFGVRLMVVEGATLVGPGRSGLERLPRAAMDMAWSVEGAR